MTTYDEWKLATPPEYADERDACPHCEDQDGGCPACAADEGRREP